MLLIEYGLCIFLQHRSSPIRFVSVKEKKKPSKKCSTSHKAEVIFVLDSSTSVGDDNWKLQLKFVTNLLAPLRIGPDADRVALVTFNTEAKVEFDLSKYSSFAEVKKAVMGVTFSEGVTATGDALKLAREQVLPHARKGAVKMLYLITDGKTNWGADPLKEAEKLKAMDVWITSVGITDEIDT